MSPATDTVNRGGVNLKFGVQWREISGISSQSREVQSLRKELSTTELGGAVTHTVIATINGHQIAGFAHSLSREKIYSAALLFASDKTISENSLLVVNVDASVTILVAVRDGAPVRGFDFIGTPAAARDLALEYHRLGSDGVTIYGNCDELEATINEYPLERLAGFADESRLMVRETGKSVLIAGAGLLAALAFVAVQYGVPAYKAYVTPQKPVIDPAVAHAQALSAAAANVSLHGSKDFALMVRTARSFQLFLYGYTLISVKCTPAVCTGMYSPTTGLASFQDFVQHYVRPELVSGSDKAITLALPVKDVAGSPLDTGKLPASAEFAAAIDLPTRIMTAAGLTIKIDPPGTPFGLPTDPTIPAQSSEDSVFTGRVVTSGPLPLLTLLPAQKMPYGMTIDAVDVVVNSSVSGAAISSGISTFVVTSTYYTRR